MVTAPNDVDGGNLPPDGGDPPERIETWRRSVAGAEAIADWGRYTWAFPWVALVRPPRLAT